MTQEFDPVKAGQEAAAINAKADQKNSDSNPESIGADTEAAHKLAAKNAKTDKANFKEGSLEPQDVGTAERDIPEGAPVTDEPKESKGVSKKATSKDADEKKDLPDDKKVQDTDKDSATPSPSKTNSPKEVPVKTADKK